MHKKRNIKTFEQYVTDYSLMKDVDTTSITSEEELTTIYKEKYNKIYFNQLLMLDVVDDNILESKSEIILSLNKNDFETDAETFYKSFNSSKRLDFLTPYTVEELKDFNLYKVRGYNIGFAIKKRTNEIILVHNNEENIKGIGSLLVNKAKELGGDNLDHFDGFLTGFYKEHGFILSNNDEWNDLYAPENWRYKKMNIYDKNKSVYSGELIVERNEFERAEERYESGKPDVIYRKIK